MDLAVLCTYLWLCLGPCQAPSLLEPSTDWQAYMLEPRDWFVQENWTEGVPTAAHLAFVQNGGIAAISAGVAEVWQLSVGCRFAEWASTVRLSGTGQLLAEKEYIGGHNWYGAYGNGKFLHDAGTNTIAARLYLGYGPEAIGTYELSGTGQLSADWEFVGYEGTGNFLQSGGTNTADTIGVGGAGASHYYHSGGTSTVRGLYVGGESGYVCTYELSGTAELSAWFEYIGTTGNASFTHTGGSNTVGDLYLGHPQTATYLLDGTGQLSARHEYIGHGWPCCDPGSARFTHAGGTNTVTGRLHVRGRTGGTAVYELRGSAELSAGAEYIGCSNGTGRFIQSGGTNTVAGDILLGIESDASARYELTGPAQVSAENVYVGHFNEGEALFIQSAGSNAIRGALYLGHGNLDVVSPSNGAYELSGTGELSAQTEYVGWSGTGRFVQTGGSNVVSGDLYLGYGKYAGGRYELSGSGQVSAERLLIGWNGSGTFIQSGGDCQAGAVFIGMFPGAEGTYLISGGRLTVENLAFGFIDGGTLCILDSGAEIGVSSLLHFGARTTFLAVPGSKIRLPGGSFVNQATESGRLSGLEVLTLVFDDGQSAGATFEAAGEDRNASWAGFFDNFTLDTLQLGNETPGRVQLVDVYDNQPNWEGAEAVYVENLLIGPGSYLDPNGLDLYYLNGGAPKRFVPCDANLDGVVNGGDYTVWADNYQQTGVGQPGGDFNGDGVVDGGDYTLWADSYLPAAGKQAGGAAPAAAPVPELAAMGLLALGGCALILRRRRGG